jgi:putative oxidoreductase
MGFLFFASGLSMLLMNTPAGVALYFASLGIPLPALAAWAAIIIKIVAGGSLMIGRYVPQSAATLIIFTLVATVIAHLDFSDPNEMTAAMKNLAIVGGLLYMMGFGPGGTNLTVSGKPVAEADPIA